MYEKLSLVHSQTDNLLFEMSDVLLTFVSISEIFENAHKVNRYSSAVLVVQSMYTLSITSMVNGWLDPERTEHEPDFSKSDLNQPF